MTEIAPLQGVWFRRYSYIMVYQYRYIDDIMGKAK